MKSRERVLASLNHKEPDIVPFDIGGTNVSGISKIAYERLIRYLGLPEREIKTFDEIQQLAVIDDDAALRLKPDILAVTPKNPLSWSLDIKDDGRSDFFKDEWGIIWSKPKNGGFYYDMTFNPLKDADNIHDIDKFQIPDTCDDSRYFGLEDELKTLASTDKAIFMVDFSAGFFELGCWLRGMEKFFVDLALDPRMACRLMDRIIEAKMVYWNKVLSLGGKYIDIVHDGEDLGTQNSLLISKEMYRKYIKPRQKKLYSFIKSRADVKIFLHSCGAIRELIPDFIEAGVDIINPVQVNTKGMDSSELKKEFGDEITFWGGGIDTQHILPNSSPREIKEEVRKRIYDLAPGGGFIFSAVHNIQADVPPENIVAMWEALHEFGQYKKIHI